MAVTDRVALPLCASIVDPIQPPAIPTLLESSFNSLALFCRNTYDVGRDSSPSLGLPPSPESEETVWVQLELRTYMRSHFRLPTSSISLFLWTRPFILPCLASIRACTFCTCILLATVVPNSYLEMELAPSHSVPVWNSWHQIH